MILEGSREGYTGRQKRKASHSEEGFEKVVVGGPGDESREWVKISKAGAGSKKKRGAPGRRVPAGVV